MRAGVSRSYIDCSDSSDSYLGLGGESQIPKGILSTVKKSYKQENSRNEELLPMKKRQSAENKPKVKPSKTKKGGLSVNETEKRAKTGAKKRAPLKPLKHEDTSISNSGLVRRQLEEDHSLKIKVNSLQKSILEQEKALKDMHKKIMNEKSDLSNLKEHVVRKVHKEQLKEVEGNQERSTMGLGIRDSKDKTPKKKLDLVKRLDMRALEIKENNNGRGLEHGSMAKVDLLRQSSYKDYRKVDSGLRDKTNEILERELDRKDEEGAFQRRRMNEMKGYMKELERKYEGEIDSLKREIQSLNEENMRIRSRMGTGKEYEKVEELYGKRIKELEEAVARKDREIAEKEGYYKGQIEDIGIRMEELQREVRKMGDYEGQVQELTQQLKLKEKEMEMTKKYYMEKLQGRVEEQARQKREWSVTYSNMLQEIRGLKGEVDFLGYENKKLNSNNSSSFRFKDDSTYVSSQRMGYEM